MLSKTIIIKELLEKKNLLNIEKQSGRNKSGLMLQITVEFFQPQNMFI